MQNRRKFIGQSVLATAGIISRTAIAGLQEEGVKTTILHTKPMYTAGWNPSRWTGPKPGLGGVAAWPN